MAYQYGQRDQDLLFPPKIDDYIDENDPVRAYDAFVEHLDLKELNIKINPRKVGAPAYDPKAMLKLLLYGYSYGVRSSRKLERATHHNLSFIWLTGNLKPDHKTIARFRKDNKSALTKLLKQCAKLCLELNLIEGNTLFIDGSKFRANASIDKTLFLKRLKEKMDTIDNHIKEILIDAEKQDRKDKGYRSFISMPDSLKNAVDLKEKIAATMKKMQEAEISSINTTDPDSVPVKSRQGKHAGYNAQFVVDDKEGLIVNADVVSQANDYAQLNRQIEQADSVLDFPSQTVCADSGYMQYDSMEKLSNQGKRVIVPAQKQIAKRLVHEPFPKEAFTYDVQRDIYICPEGHCLKFYQTKKENKSNVYKIEDPQNCLSCQHFGTCTKAPSGRSIGRYWNESYREEMAQAYLDPENQKIFKRRKMKVELPFGHIKRNLQAGYFLLRSLSGVRAEISLLASCFNIRRLISILGMPLLLAMLSS